MIGNNAAVGAVWTDGRYRRWCSKYRGGRLGDVVVSQPNQGYGGVIQYDFGKNHSKRLSPDGVPQLPAANTT
jgi:hypothetical protein